MKRFEAGRCPVCSSKLNIGKLACPDCKAEYPINASMNPFAYLTEQQADFLKLYLQSRGSLKAVGERTNSSYPTVKRRLEELLAALGYAEEEEITEEVATDMAWKVVENPQKASEVIRNKMIDAGGRIIVRSYNGKPHELTLIENGNRFNCPQLIPYEFQIFDVMVDVMVENGGRARKGNGRKKLGEDGCEENTIAGAILKNYFGVKPGGSGLDPAFVMIGVLEWAGIAKNQRGYVELTAEYRAKYCK